MTVALRLCAAVAALLALALVPSTAGASPSQEAWFQDDNELIYNEPADVERRLDELAEIGVDRLRLTVLWSAVAPSPNAATRPAFDAANPDAYPEGTWSNYDTVLREAAERGLKVNFNLTGPSPLWANQPSPRRDVRRTYEPSPSEFAQFVVAVGRRYSGQTAGIPRVDHWSIWNEPNHSGWLTPTWEGSGRSAYERSAVLYRQLLHAGYLALVATGHADDTILVGETAPSGNDRVKVKSFMKPMVFIRALYCVDSDLRRLRGRRARLLECGSSASGFRRANPALFRASGFGHHPYQLLTAPSVKPKDPDVVTMAVLSRLTRTLDRVMRRYSSRRRLPLYLTEYGYQTPPDPLGVPLIEQGAFLNESEWMAMRNPRVRALGQFLLVDDGPPVRLTFQSGLVDRQGRYKAAYPAYRLPVWLRGSGSRKRVWALLRPAPSNRQGEAVIQYRPKGSRTYRTVKVMMSSGVRNIVSTLVTAKPGGSLRVVFGPFVSRTVAVE